MVKSLEIHKAVDSLAIQRSLTILEDRYRELRETGEQRFKKYEEELSSITEQRDGLQHELSSITDQRDGLQHELSVTSEQRDALQTELNATKDQRDGLQHDIQEAREEGELLLLQLHQVQEELEHNFLMARDLGNQLDTQSRKLSWLRSQREELMQALRSQQSLVHRIAALNTRLAIFSRRQSRQKPARSVFFSIGQGRGRPRKVATKSLKNKIAARKTLNS